MSRHRDIRSMKYSDEYDGYDDVYGHSVEDDYCVSPGAEQFLYDRNKQQNIASFINEPDIKEDDEEIDDASALAKKSELSEIDTAKLMSCIEVVRNVIGDTIPDSVLTDKIILNNFNAEAALDDILKSTPPKHQTDGVKAKDRGETQSGSLTMKPNNLKPKLNLLIKKPTSSIFGSKKTETKSSQGFSSLSELIASHKSKSTSEKPKFSSSSGLISNHAGAKDDKAGDKKSFSSLAEMTAHHLKSTSPFKKSGKNSFVIPKLSNKAMASSTINLPVKLIKAANESDTSRSSDVDKVSLDVKNLQLDNNCEGRDQEKDEDEESHWEIDLTKALRQPGSPAIISSKTKLSNGQNVDIKSQDNFNLKELYNNINEPVCSSIVVDSIEVLECNMTLIDLKYAELHHFNKMASPFGKMLCREWKSKRPYVKKSKSEFSDKIKPFDFSSPSPDSLILANLRR